MADTHSIPYFAKEALIAVMKRMDERDMMRPLLRLFPRQPHEGDLIKVRKHKRRPGQVRHTSIGGKAMPVRRGTLDEIEYRPSNIKLWDFITEADLELFARAEEAQSLSEATPSGRAALARANQRIVEIAQNLRDDNAEERHRLMCGALQGSVTYRMGDDQSDTTVSYGLTSLSAPGTDWSDAGANIIDDILGWYEEFRDNNSLGLAPTHVFYDPKAYLAYMQNNTEFQTWKKQNEEQARGFLGMGGFREADWLGRINTLMGLRWVPIEGTYQNLSDSATDRWATDKLVFAHFDETAARDAFEMGGGNGFYEWGMNLRALSQPTADVHIETKMPQQGDDVKVIKVTSFDNGLPVLLEPELVQPVDVVA